MNAQQKPRVFISSTIRDFGDLRSAIKFYLEEQGFEVSLSEHNDIDKPIELNTFDACFEAIKNSDYYVLLVGRRRGSLYGESPKVSVTQQEYRVAYEQALAGRMRLVLLVREPVWSVYCEVTPGSATPPTQAGGKDGEDTAFIFEFLDEITRKEEVESAIRQGVGYPPANWVHSFKDFRDIVDVLRIALQAKVPLARRVLETNLESELVENVRILCSRVTMSGCDIPLPVEQSSAIQEQLDRLGADVSFKEWWEKHQVQLPFLQYMYMKKTRNSLALASEDMKKQILLSAEALSEIGSFCLAMSGVKGKLQHAALDAAIESGAFLEYSTVQRRYIVGPEQHGLLTLRDHLKSLEGRLALLDQRLDPSQPTHLETLLAISVESGNKEYQPGDKVLGYRLAIVFAVYDSCVNVLAQMVNILSWLQQSKPVPDELELRPVSPLQGESEKIELESLPRETVADPLFVQLLEAIVRQDLPSQ